MGESVEPTSPLARSPNGVVAAAATGTGARNGTAIASRVMR